MKFSLLLPLSPLLAAPALLLAQTPVPAPASAPSATQIQTPTPASAPNPAPASPTPTAPLTRFTNAAVWPDATAGAHVNVHGGGILCRDGVYYWYGEYRSARRSGLPATQGVGCYSSRDLYNWKNEGVVLPVVNGGDPEHDLVAGSAIERPKVIYNAKTGKYVMWFHLEFRGRGYGAARTASAVADTPLGPFKYLRSLRPNPGVWPIGFPENQRSPLSPPEAEDLLKANQRQALIDGAYARRDFAGGQMARDMTLFVDDDNKAYLVDSAEENYTLNIHELTDDYLDFTGRWARVVPGGHNEAPALIKRAGKYHLLVSGCTGWAPNDARSFVADSIWGPWKQNRNPCEGVNPQTQMGPEKTFGGQSTFILPVPGKKDAFIAMFDIWRPRNLEQSSHIWLPVEFENDQMVIRWRDDWDLSVFKR